MNINLFIIQSEIELIIASSIMRKNDHLVTVGQFIDRLYLDHIVQSKNLRIIEIKKTSRRNFIKNYYLLKKWFAMTKYNEIYTQSDESNIFRIINSILNTEKISLIENGEKSYINNNNKKLIKYFIGNTFDLFALKILKNRNFKVFRYGKSNIKQIIGLLDKNQHSLKHKIINKDDCIWPKDRILPSKSVVYVLPLMKYGFFKDIEKELSEIKTNAYLKFHPRESEEIKKKFNKFNLLDETHSIESYFHNKDVIFKFMTKNSSYYYSKLYDV